MQRLSGLDTAFLALDGPTSAGHLVLLVVLDGDLALDTLRFRLADRIPVHPVLHRRLVTTPGGVGRPWWAEAEPRLDDHLGEGCLPDSWTRADLADAGLEASRRPLPRDRPLWRADLLRTRSGANSVLALAVHHAAADGLAVRDLVSGLLDDPEPAGPTRPHDGESDHLPAAVRRWAGVIDLPLAAGAAVVPVAASAAKLPASLAGSLASRLPGGRTRRAGEERGALRGRVGAERCLAFGDVPLAPVRALRASHDASVNDVLLAATAGALRRLLVERGQAVTNPLHAAVPVALRRQRWSARKGNSVMVARCALPVHEPTAEERLRQVRSAMRRARSSPLADDALVEALGRMAVPALATPVVRIASRLGIGARVPLPFDLMVSNVPGATYRGALAGHRVEGMYPVPLVGEGLGLNVTVHGCADTLHHAVASSPDVLDDPARLVALLEEEHDRLAALAR